MLFIDIYQTGFDDHLFTITLHLQVSKQIITVFAGISKSKCGDRLLAQLTVLQIFSCLPSALRLQLRIIILGRQLVHLKQRTSRICSFFRFF